MDDYYLKHTIDKKYDKHGSIYIQKVNKKDFSDPLTVIYGHNMRDGSMYKELHKYKKEDFFRTHSNIYIYIYLPDKSLCFDVLSVVNRGNIHLLKEFDLNTKEGLVNFLSYIGNNTQIEKDIEYYHVKKNNFIALSTCDTNNEKTVVFAGVSHCKDIADK